MPKSNRNGDFFSLSLYGVNCLSQLDLRYRFPFDCASKSTHPCWSSQELVHFFQKFASSASFGLLGLIKLKRTRIWFLPKKRESNFFFSFVSLLSYSSSSSTTPNLGKGNLEALSKSVFQARWNLIPTFFLLWWHFAFRNPAYACSLIGNPALLICRRQPFRDFLKVSSRLSRLAALIHL